MSTVKEPTEVTSDEHPIAPNLRMDRIPHIWCPTCGIGTVVKCFVTALEQTGVDLNKVSIVSGIGCTGRVGGYMNLDAFHTTHGRAIPFATGLILHFGHRYNQKSVHFGSHRRPSACQNLKV